MNQNLNVLLINISFCVGLLPKNASTCWPIGLDHIDKDDPLDRGGSSGGYFSCFDAPFEATEAPVEGGNDGTVFFKEIT